MVNLKAALRATNRAATESQVRTMADAPMPVPEDILDKPGDWEIRVTIYRNGKRVGTCDTRGWETYSDAAYWVGEGLTRPEIEMHVPKRRARRAGR